MWIQRDKNFQESSQCIASASIDDIHVHTMHGDVNEIEPKVLKLKDAQAFGKDSVNLYWEVDFKYLLLQRFVDE